MKSRSARRRADAQHVDGSGRVYDVTEPEMPELQPGESRTTVPDRWCENCQQARPLRKCSFCGHLTVLRADLPDDPAAADVVALAKLQGIDVPGVRVIDEDTVELPKPLGMGEVTAHVFVPDPADEGDGEDGDALLAHEDGLNVHIGPVVPPPDLQGDLEAAAFGTDNLSTDAAAPAAPPGPMAPRARGSLLGALEESRAKREAGIEALPASSIRPAMSTYSDRERAVMERPRGPMARGAVDRPSHRGPIQENKRPRERTSMQSTRAATQHELDERGRPVQHTIGRSKTRTVEDQLIGQWEAAKVDRTVWSGFLAAAMSRADVNSISDAAELADEAYMELLKRDRYATGG